MNDVRRHAGRKALLAFGLFCSIAMATFSQEEQKGQILEGIRVSESNPSLIFNYLFFLLSSTLRFSFAAMCTTNFSRF